MFLDACGADWEYEPEGYDLGGGIQYLPDFLIHNVTIGHAYHKEGIDLYMEVKGRMNDEDAEKINLFYEAGYPEGSDWGVSQTAVLVVGSIPAGDSMNEMVWHMEHEAYNDHHGWPNYYNFETVDGDYFGAFPGVNKKGRFTLFGDDSSYFFDMNVLRTERAYHMARQARFEHGETPRIRRYR